MALWLVIALTIVAWWLLSEHPGDDQVERTAGSADGKTALQVISESQLLERAQKSRELLGQQETDSVNKQIAQLRTDSTDLRTRMASSTGATLSDLDTRLKETTSRIGKLESESRIAQQIVQDYTNSVCLIYVVLGFHDNSRSATEVCRSMQLAARCSTRVAIRS